MVRELSRECGTGPFQVLYIGYCSTKHEQHPGISRVTRRSSSSQKNTWALLGFTQVTMPNVPIIFVILIFMAVQK